MTVFPDPCTPTAAPDFSGWVPGQVMTMEVDTIDIGDVTFTGTITTEEAFACVFDDQGDHQGWAFATVDDPIETDQTAVRGLGFRDLTGMSTSPWALPAGWSLGICQVENPTDLVFEVARLCGDQPGTATIERFGSGVDPVPGNTITIPGGYRALSWTYLRQTQQDPGDGSVASVIVNDQIQYAPGSGYQYQQHGWELSSHPDDRRYVDPLTFEVTGEAYIEILIVRDAAA